MPLSRLSGLGWILNLPAAAWLAVIATAAAAGLFLTCKLRKGLHKEREEAAGKRRELALALAQLEQARVLERERADSLESQLSRARHDLLGQLNIVSGFLLLLKPEIESKVEAVEFAYFERALAALDRSITAAGHLRDEEFSAEVWSSRHTSPKAPSGDLGNIESPCHREAAP